MIHKMLFCKGSHSEIGRKHGELLSTEIRHNLSGFWNELKRRGLDKKAVIKNALKLEKI